MLHAGVFRRTTTAVGYGSHVMERVVADGAHRVQREGGGVRGLKIVCFEVKTRVVLRSGTWTAVSAMRNSGLDIRFLRSFTDLKVGEWCVQT